MDTIITLTTDFGTEDAYVAVMKGVIMSINPRATVIDISHHIEPQNIAQGAFVLMTAYPYFPDGTIHVAVIDPGVGGARRGIVLRAQSTVFVAPDNGLLSYSAYRATAEGWSGRGANEQLPSGLQAFEITNPAYWRHPVGPTFHGRDIFAPVAAHISTGVALREFGEPVRSIHLLPPPEPEALGRGELAGHVLHIDHFGNVITDIQREDLPSERFFIEIAEHQIESLGQTYSEASGLTALIGSSGYLEIALRDGSAAHFLGIGIGGRVRVRGAV